MSIERDSNCIELYSEQEDGVPQTDREWGCG